MQKRSVANNARKESKPGQECNARSGSESHISPQIEEQHAFWHAVLLFGVRFTQYIRTQAKAKRCR